MKLLPLRDATAEDRFGGKAVHLGAALRAGLPVPPGLALSTELVDEIAAGETRAVATADAMLREAGGLVAVRSSAVGEDSVHASFAGQHLTVLGVSDPAAVVSAVTRVWASARSESALAYRQRMGVAGAPRMGVVVQALVRAEIAGVLFTRNPLSGADERVIEASWGLGEAVVAGMVTPDRYRVARGGRVLERASGEKDVALEVAADGTTHEREIEGARVTALCLDDRALARLDELAARCEGFFGGEQDLEFAFVGDELFLLQRRAITRRAATAR